MTSSIPDPTGLREWIQAWIDEAPRAIGADSLEAEIRAEIAAHKANAFAWLIEHGREVPTWIEFRHRMASLTECQRQHLCMVLSGAYPFPDTLLDLSGGMSMLIQRGEMDENLNYLPIEGETA